MCSDARQNRKCKQLDVCTVLLRSQQQYKQNALRLVVNQFDWSQLGVDRHMEGRCVIKQSSRML